MVSCWAHLGHAVQSPIRDPWTSSKWVKASIAHNTAAHNESRSGPRSNKTTLAACKTMLSSLSNCALKKKIASSSSSLLQSLTRAWFFRCTAKALGARTAPRARWDGERRYGPSRARAISHREILCSCSRAFSYLVCDYLQGAFGKRFWGAGRSDASLGLKVLLWPREREPDCFWTEEVDIWIQEKDLEVHKTKNTLLPQESQWSTAFPPSHIYHFY